MNYIIRPARLADASEITKVHIESWQTSYRNIIPKKYLDEISFNSRLEMRKQILSNDDTLTLVACHGETGKIIGFCDAGPTKDKSYESEIYSIYLLEDYKELGIGSNLFLAALRWLIDNQMSNMILWVLKDNTSARRFYEKLGGRINTEKTIEIGGVKYPEVSYTWSLNLLRSQSLYDI